MSLTRDNSNLPQNQPFEQKEENADSTVDALETYADGDMLKSLQRAMEAEGLPKKVTTNLIDRMRKKHVTTGMRLQKVRNQDLLDLVSNNARRVLESVTEEDIEKASLKDKAIASGIFIEKRQLLKGEPTQILTVNERKSLDVLVQVAVQEATRRGVTLDVSAEGTPQITRDESEPVLLDHSLRERTGAASYHSRKPAKRDDVVIE